MAKFKQTVDWKVKKGLEAPWRTEFFFDRVS